MRAVAFMVAFLLHISISEFLVYTVDLVLRARWPLCEVLMLKTFSWVVPQRFATLDANIFALPHIIKKGQPL